MQQTGSRADGRLSKPISYVGVLLFHCQVSQKQLIRLGFSHSKGVPQLGRPFKLKKNSEVAAVSVARAPITKPLRPGGRLTLKRLPRARGGGRSQASRARTHVPEARGCWLHSAARAALQFQRQHVLPLLSHTRYIFLRTNKLRWIVFPAPLLVCQEQFYCALELALFTAILDVLSALQTAASWLQGRPHSLQ